MTKPPAVDKQSFCGPKVVSYMMYLCESESKLDGEFNVHALCTDQTRKTTRCSADSVAFPDARSATVESLPPVDAEETAFASAEAGSARSVMQIEQLIDSRQANASETTAGDPTRKGPEVAGHLSRKE